jgi:hypothetical protein
MPPQCTDKDGDGYGTGNCALDCDDTDARVYKLVLGYADADGDGFATTSKSFCTDGSLPHGFSPSVLSKEKDCDDSSPITYPGALDIAGNEHVEDCTSGVDRPASIETGVFVNNWAAPGGDGSQKAPFDNLAAGLKYAMDRGVDTVFVAAQDNGKVQPYVIKEPLGLGVSINGGFAIIKDQWVFDAKQRAEIVSENVAPVLDVLETKAPMAIANLRIDTSDPGPEAVLRHGQPSTFILSNVVVNTNVVYAKSFLAVSSTDSSGALLIDHSTISVMNSSKDTIEMMYLLDVSGRANIADSTIGASEFTALTNESIGLIIRPKAFVRSTRSQWSAGSATVNTAIGVLVQSGATFVAVKSKMTGAANNAGSSVAIATQGDVTIVASEIQAGLTRTDKGTHKTTGILAEGSGRATVVSSVIDCGTSGLDKTFDQASGVLLVSTKTETPTATLVNTVLQGNPDGLYTPPVGVRSEGAANITAVNTIFVSKGQGKALSVSQSEGSSVRLLSNAWDGGDAEFDAKPYTLDALNACEFPSCKVSKRQRNTQGISFGTDASGFQYRHTAKSVAIDSGDDPRSLGLGAGVLVDFDLDQRFQSAAFDLGPDEM